MQPIESLMTEHRLIERMLTLVEREAARMEAGADPDLVFLDMTADFLHTYVDRCHHGKEEGVLFKALRGKPLAEADRRMLDELQEEHVASRRYLGRLIAGRQGWAGGNRQTAPDILAALREIGGMYTRHIAKEDERFFPRVMEYFTGDEQQDMLREGYEIDRKMIHVKYRAMMETLEFGQATA